MANTKEHKPHTTLQDLPAEIRTEIYGYVLIEPTAIAICAFKPKTDDRKAARPKTTGPRLIRDNNRNKYHRGETYDRNQNRWVLLPPLRTAILHVNKQIHAEATQVLLGTNHFKYRNSLALDQCLDVLGPRAQHLRYVYIGGMGYVKKHANNTFTKLGNSAPFLKKLQIDHYYICQSVRNDTLEGSNMISYIVRDCKEMLKLLEKSYEAGSITFNPLEIVDCYLQPYTTYWGPSHPDPAVMPHGWHMAVATASVNDNCACVCGQAEQQDEKMRQELRRRMGKALGVKMEEGEDGK